MDRIKIRSSYILAGGQSRRMGKDKLFMEIDGKSLLQKTIDVCLANFSSVSIVAKEKKKFQETKLPILIDAPGAQGPMAGVITALSDCQTDCCFITAADFYDLDNVIIKMLIENYQNEEYLGLAEPGGVQPLCGIYSTSALTKIIKQAESGNYKMSEAVARLKHKLLPIENKRWRNINNPDDLIKLGDSL